MPPEPSPSLIIACRILCLSLLLYGLWLLPGVPATVAGPVDWVEVPASQDGRQWWDRGSLRRTRDGHLSVLSRFSPAPEDGEEGDRGPPAGSLYVMEVNCDQVLYRDISVNGLPRWGAAWQLVTGDPLLESLLYEVCLAGRSLDRFA